MKENIRELKLSKWQSAFFHCPFLYRLAKVDYFLAGFLAAALTGFLFRAHLLLSAQTQQVIFYVSFVLLILIVNRVAFLFSGRARVNAVLLKKILTILVVDKTLDLRNFALRTGVSFEKISQVIDCIMVENYYLGSIDAKSLVLHISENPLQEKRCPCCDGLLTDSMLIEKSCGFCGSVFYI